MERIVIRLTRRVKKRLRQTRRTTRDAGLAQRCQIVLHAAKGRPSRTIAEAVGCSRSWVSRVLQRFLKDGEAGLVDRREDNGQQKLDEWYLAGCTRWYPSGRRTTDTGGRHGRGSCSSIVWRV